MANPYGVFGPRVARFHVRPQYQRQLGNGGLGHVLGYRILDADTGRLGGMLPANYALAQKTCAELNQLHR